MKKNIKFHSMYSAFVSIIIMLFGAGLVGTASICLAQDSPWTTKADIPSPRWFLSSSSANGKIYAIGGGIGFGPEDGLAATEEYDPATDTWTPKARMLGRRADHATAVFNGQVYILGGAARGGGPAFSNLWVYDPTTDTWDNCCNSRKCWKENVRKIKPRLTKQGGMHHGFYPISTALHSGLDYPHAFCKWSVGAKTLHTSDESTGI